MGLGTSKSLNKLATIPEGADPDTIEVQLKLTLGDAVDQRLLGADMDCVIAHLLRLLELTTTKGLLDELVKRASTHDGVNDNDLSMLDLLTGMERIAENIAYWSKVEHSYTPEVVVHQTILQALEIYRLTK